ncbi:MAG: carboxypeptidase-like regulatory domain-containing protein [Bacteroidota bacterium]
MNRFTQKHWWMGLACLLLNSLTVQAQSDYLISGTVFDQDTKEALFFSKVTLKKGKKVITETYVNEEGQFELPKVPKGKYTLSVFFIGYQPFESKRFRLESDQTQWHILMPVDAVNLTYGLDAKKQPVLDHQRIFEGTPYSKEEIEKSAGRQ